MQEERRHQGAGRAAEPYAQKHYGDARLGSPESQGEASRFAAAGTGSKGSRQPSTVATLGWRA